LEAESLNFSANVNRRIGNHQTPRQPPFSFASLNLSVQEVGDKILTLWHISGLGDDFCRGGGDRVHLLSRRGRLPRILGGFRTPAFLNVVQKSLELAVTKN
jgi:hypothetical protein